MRIILFLSFFCLYLPVSAQQNSDSLSWYLNLDEAQSIALHQQRQILLVFSGSDWCRPCMKLEKELFQSTSFAEYAEEHFVLLKADFPRSRKHRLPKDQQSHNSRLAERFNPKGQFPYLVLLSSNGDAIDQIGYLGSQVDSYLQHWSSIQIP